MSNADLLKYSKPYLDVPKQLDLLENRGMIIGDRRVAAACLSRIGYYRLKSYWGPFKDQDGLLTGDQDHYRLGTKFHFGVDLYIFDKKLRLLFLDALERIEVALRVAIAHTVGERGAWAHHDLANLDPNQLRPSKPRPDGTVKKGSYQRWRDAADHAERRARPDWVKEHRERYDGPLPLWMAVELWDFGLLSQFLAMARAQDRMTIAAKFNLPNPAILVSWVQSLTQVRNLCAHHSRLWNHPLSNVPSLTLGHELKVLEHIVHSDQMRTRVYGSAAITQYLMTIINPKSEWKLRLRTLWTEFPRIPGVSPEQAGFLDGWETQPIWNLDHS